MGVVGLTSHLQRSRRAAHVDLLQEARRRQQRRSDTQPTCGRLSDSDGLVSRYIAHHSDCLFLLLDGLGVFQSLSGIDAAVCRALPRYDALQCRVSALLLSLAQHRIRLIAYFDTASTESSKKSELMKRSDCRLRELLLLSRSLHTARIASFSPLRCESEADDEHEQCQSHCPQLMQRQVVWTLRSLGVCVVRCEQEADLRLSQDARRFSCQVLGIVSNDSDCAIMRGVSWIPLASLVLRWTTAAPGQRGVEVDDDMRGFFSSARPQAGTRRQQPSASHSAASSLLPARSGLLCLSHASCSVWSNADVAAALLLPSVSQLVELAVLVGNDFTREFTAHWEPLLPRARGCSRIERCVAFLKQQRHLRVESMPALQQCMRSNGQLRRAVRLSRAIYDGELLQTEGTGGGDDGVDSLTAELDALQLPAADLAAVGQRVAAGLCSAHTMSVLVRDYDITPVYLEQIREAADSALALPVSGPACVDFSSLLLPECEQVTRLLRAAFALLCGRSSHAIIKVVGREFTEVKAAIEYGPLLPNYTLPLLAATSGNGAARCRLPLLLVPETPLPLRIGLFCRPFAALAHIASASQDISEALLLSCSASASALPLTLRLPVLACRFLLHSYCSHGLNPELAQPLLDSLLCMTLLLHALMPATATSPPSSPASSSLSAARSLLTVVDSHRASFPLMLAAGLSSHYQSVCSRLIDLSVQLQLPQSCLPCLPPDRLYHGPLLLSLLQDAVLQPSLFSSSSAVDVCRYRLASQRLSVSSIPSSHQALQAVTTVFRYHAASRQCVFQRRLQDAAIIGFGPQSEKRTEAPVAVPSLSGSPSSVEQWTTKAAQAASSSLSSSIPAAADDGKGRQQKAARPTRAHLEEQKQQTAAVEY